MRDGGHADPGRRRALARRAPIALVAAVLALVALAPVERAAAAGTDAGHVHALAFDPGDRSLLLGTHDGLYRLGSSALEPRKVGRVSYDLMGLAVLGPRSYVASGHPDAEAARRDGLPSNLGLIRSDDGGLGWRSVSLGGGADFHVLRARERRVLAFDVVHRRLLASPDAGRTWSSRQPPPGTFDLALGPAQGSVAVSTSAGVQVSDDGGVSYRPRARRVGPGLVAWPTPRTLLLVDSGGIVRASSDGGRTFARRGTVAGQPVALASDGGRVGVLLATGRLLLSVDGGRRFTAVTAP